MNGALVAHWADALLPLSFTFSLALCRIGAALFVLPLFSDTLPQLQRVAISMMLALLCTLNIGTVRLFELAVPLWLMMCARELFIGLTMGFFARVICSAFDSAGQVIGLQLGLGFSGMLDPMQQEESLVTARLLSIVAWLGFVAAGGIEQLILGLLASFYAQPVGSNIVISIEPLLELLHNSMTLAVRLMLPVLAGTLMVQLMLALLGRTLSELNPYALSFTAITLLGLWLFVPTMTAANSFAVGIPRDIVAAWSAFVEAVP